jgi:hypothetical protein
VDAQSDGAEPGHVPRGEKAPYGVDVGLALGVVGGSLSRRRRCRV